MTCLRTLRSAEGFEARLDVTPITLPSSDHQVFHTLGSSGGVAWHCVQLQQTVDDFGQPLEGSIISRCTSRSAYISVWRLSPLQLFSPARTLPLSLRLAVQHRKIVTPRAPCSTTKWCTSPSPPPFLPGFPYLQISLNAADFHQNGFLQDDEEVQETAVRFLDGEGRAASLHVVHRYPHLLLRSYRSP